MHHGYITPPTNSGPLFVTHHGAGSSGLSFAVLFSELRKILPGAGIISLDARGHGNTTSVHPGKEEVPLDLTLDTLSDDVIFILKETRRKMGWPELPDMLLIGHSLGGAVMTEVAKKGQLGSSLLGYAVLDVVEGELNRLRKTARALIRFRRLSNGRPPKHGNVSFNKTHWFSLCCLWDRMAHPITNHPQHNLSPRLRPFSAS